MASGSSLSARFARALAIAALCGVVLFAVLQSLGSAVIDCYVENSDYLEKCANERTESFQKFVDTHELASTDTAQLFEWCKQQPPLLMEVFHNGRLVFNSSYSGDENLFDMDIEARYYDWYSYYTIEFSDGTAELFIYCDDVYQLHVWTTIICGVVSFLAVLLIFLAEVRKVARYIRLLSSEIQSVKAKYG